MAGLFDDIPVAGASGASSSRGLFDDLPEMTPGSFLTEVGKGIAAGGISAAGTAIKGAGAALTTDRIVTGGRRLDILRRVDEGEDVFSTLPDLTPDEAQLAREYGSIEDPDVRAQFRKNYEDAAGSTFKDSSLIKAGEAVQEFGKEQFPAAQDYEDSWTRAISEGLGSVGVMVGSSVLSGPAAPIVGAGIGSAMSAGEALDRAVEAGATQEQIVEAVKLGALPGLTEQIPIETLFERVPLPVVGKLGGAISKILGQAFAEGGQEAVQQAAQNLIERFTYNPEQDILEGVAEAAAIGAAVGGIVKTGERAVSAVTGKAEAPVTTAKTDRLPASIERPIAPEAVPGDTERLSSPRLTPEDRASPIPNDIIDDGKAILESIEKGVPVPGVTAPTAEETIVRDQESLTKQIERAAATPLERATLRVAGNTDDEIDVMSVEERRADFQSAIEAGVMPNAQDLAEAEKYKIAPLAGEAAAPAAAEPVPGTVGPSEAIDAPSASPDAIREQMDSLRDQRSYWAGKVQEAEAAGDIRGMEAAIAKAKEFDAPIAELAAKLPKRPMKRAHYTTGEFDEPAPGTLASVRGLETDANSQRPAAIQTAEQMEAAVARVNTNPTEKQKAAGNYEKAHLKVNGYDIAIENPKGSIRSKKRPDGSTEWQVKMPAHYGELKRTTGADGDAVDVYVGDNPTSKRIYIIDQKAPVERGRFDEHKVVFGASNIQEAKDIYIRGFSDGSGRNRLGAIASVTPKAFREWLADPATSNRPFSMGVVKTNEEGFPVDAKGAVKRPPSLTEFLAQNGGIREDMGELAAMDADKVFIPGVGKLVRPTGLTLDQARGMLVENGYLTDSEAGELSTSTVDDLLVALRDDISARDQFSVYDDDWATAYRGAKYNEEFAEWEGRQAEQVLADLQAAGYTGTLDDAYAKRVVELVLSERMELSDAAERAAFEDDGANAEVIAPDPALEEIPFDAPDTGAAQQGSVGTQAPGRGGKGGAREEGDAGTPGDAASSGGAARPSQERDEGSAGQGRPQVDDFDAAFDSALDETFPQPTTEKGVEGKPQLVIPGAEKIPDKQFAEMQAAKPMRSDKPQRDLPAGGLFDDIARNQQDMFDQPAKKPAMPSFYGALSAANKAAFDAASDTNKDIAIRLGNKIDELARADNDDRVDQLADKLGPILAAMGVKPQPIEGMTVPAAAPQQSAKMTQPATQAELNQVVEMLKQPAYQTEDGFDRALADIRAGGKRDPKKPIGVNRRGNPVYEDERGVRSYSERGVRVSESVQIIPGKGVSIDKSQRGSDYQTEAEYAEDRAEAAKAAEATAKAKSAVKNVAMGLDEITKGLSELFGGAKVSSGLSFDEDTYAKALPFFKAGIAHFAEAGRDVAGMVKALVQHLAKSGMDRVAIENMRPYVRRFVEDESEKSTGKLGNAEVAEDAEIVAEIESPTEIVQGISEPASNPAEKINTPAREGVLGALVDRLLSPDGKFATILEARKFLQDNGWKPVNQAIATKEAEEFIENAVVLAARDIVKAGNKRGAATVYDRLVGLYDRQPRLGSRTSTSMAEQAYSTPAPLAYIASRLAGIDATKSVLEPTAGNGMLLIEASPAKAAVNELNPTRADNLTSQGFRVSRNDASEERLRHAGYPVDVVIANPPFGAVREGGQSRLFEIDGHRTTAIDQAIALNALRSMKDDGKAVLIVGSVKEGSEAERSDNYNTSQKRKFYKRLYDNYRVVEHFTVAGDLYAKQGAGWPVDVIVIDGKGKSAHPLPAVRVPKLVSSWAALKDYLDVGGRTDQGETQLPRPAGQEVRPAPARMPVSEGGSAAGGRPAGGARPADQPAASERPAEPGKPETDRGQPEAGGDLAGRPGQGPVAGGTDRGGVRVAVAAQPRESRVRADANTTGQVPYRPYSRRGTPLNTLVPHALGASMDESLARIEAQHGDIDAYVAEALGYSLEELPSVFSAEQVDAIALAINNVANGDAFIIGDQTGIGKGRVVAAAIRFAHKSGMTPVFVTEKPDLYGDMYRDLGDIKWSKSLGREPKIFMTNSGTTVPLDDEAVEWIIERDEAKAAGRKAPPRRGQFSTSQSVEAVDKQMREILAGKFKPDVIFTTYDQMNSIKGAETNRRRFMDQMAGQAFVIMDESHNAGGQGAKASDRGKKDAVATRAEKFREWVGKAKSVMYSSATYAKNPQVMDLYSRTDMAKAVEDPKDLPELIAKGKVPLQQVVASMLAKAGQYARRERSFEGVEYALEVATVDKGNYAEFATSIRKIFEFDRAITKFRQEWISKYLKENASGMAMDSGIGEMAANSTEFASIMHNIVNQMLLSIKADAAASKALASLENGEKPVIALSFTAESFVTDYAEDKGISLGEDMNITFNDVVQRYLERTRRITLKDSDDVKSHVYIPVDELGEFEDAYHDAMAAVEAMDLSAMPVSPIDHIRARLTKAGYKVAEVTGRGTMLNYAKGNALRYESRPSEEQGASGKRATIKKFNDGGLDAVILNKSGSTGVSMHASSKFKDKRRRRMILAQADPNIDTHMQMLGRVHRTGQVIPPAYTQLAADIPAEARPTAVLMKKMASLNANTTASRKSAFTTDAVDFMNEYGDLAAVQWAKDNPDVNERLGAPIRFDDKGKATGENPIQKLTGRIMLLDPDAQQELLDNLTHSFNNILAQKEALGENALEAKALDLQAEPVSKTEIKPATGSSPFQEAATMETMRVKSTGRAMKPRDVVDRVADELGQRPADLDQFERSLRELQPIGQRKSGKQIEAMREEHQKYVQWTVGGLKDPEAKARATQKANESYQAWSDIMRLAPIGAHVTMVSGSREMPAIVVDVHQSNKKAKSPHAGSAWSVALAIPDSARQLTVPFSQLSTRVEEDSDAIVIQQPGWQDRDLTNLAGRFEQAAKEGKEERLIATGNLLAAFDQLQGKGQIIQFTDASGDVKPGIMMPRGFDMAQWAADRRIPLSTPAQVMRFLSESEGKSVTTKDDVITVENSYRGYEFTMPASRAKGGKYFTDATVRRVYDDWRKQGLNMVATVDQGRAERLISAMQGIGARFVAPGEPELASSIAFPKKGTDLSVAGWDNVEGGVASPKISAAELEEVRRIVTQVSGAQFGTMDTIKIPANHPGLLAWGKADEASTAAGFYSREYDVIIVALDNPEGSGPRLAYHESFHRLQERFLTKAEKATLKDSRENLKGVLRAEPAIFTKALLDGMSQREIEAEAFSVYATKKDAGLPLSGFPLLVRQAFARLHRIARAVKNWLAGNGYQTWEDVFEAAGRGEILARGDRGRSTDNTGAELQPAWHGTPHTFDRFTLDKIGTGEGAQAYGWGLYFAGKKEVAEHYRDKLKRVEATVAGYDAHEVMRTPTRSDPEDNLLVEIAESLELTVPDGADPRVQSILDNRASGWMQGAIKAVFSTLARDLDAGTNIARALDKQRIEYDSNLRRGSEDRERAEAAVRMAVLTAIEDKVEVKGQGRLFKVDVPETNELLDWDKPLSEQPEGVREKLISAEFLPPDVLELVRLSSELERIRNESGTRGEAYAAAYEAKESAALSSNELHRRYGVWDAGDLTGARIYADVARRLGYPAPAGTLMAQVEPSRLIPDDRAASEAFRAAGIPGHRYIGHESQSTNYVIYDDTRIGVEEMFSLQRAAPGAAVDPQGIPSVSALASTVGRSMMNHIKRGKPDGETVGEYSHRKLIDYLHPLRQMVEGAGGAVQDSMNAYLQARLAEDAALARIQGMHGEYVTPMVDALARSGASLEDFHRYLYARHVAERNRVVGARNPENSDFFKAIEDHDIKGASGWSTNEAKRVLRELSEKPGQLEGIREAARLMRGMLNKNLADQKRAGLISDETYELLTEQWKHYVPLRADDGMDANGNFKPGRGRGFDVRGKEFESATGRFTEAENIPAWAVSLAERTHLRAEKNNVGKAVLRFLNHFDPAGEELAQVYWTGEEGFGDLEKAPEVYRRKIGADGKVHAVKVPYSTIAPDMFAVKFGGKSYYIKFNDEKVGLALKKMGVVDLDSLSRLVRKFTGWQSLINTRANPAFVPINIIRDAATGGIHLLDEGFSVKEAARIVKSIPKAWGALWRNAKGRQNMESAYDRALKDYIGAGGKITFEPHKTIEDSINELRKQMDVAANGKSKPRAMWDAFTFFIGALNDVGENGIRLATYVAQREKGKTVKQAAFSARDLTVDFKKHGEVGPLMNSWFVFFNASIQGNYNIAARLAKSKTIRRAAFTIAASAVLVDLMNRVLSGEDDDEESYYDKLLRTEPWVFERNIVLFVGSGAGDYIKIPMPYGYNAIYNVGLQAAAAAHGTVSPLEALASTTRVAFDAFNPVGSGGSFLNLVVPTILDPVADIYTNMNFTGAPISPTRYPGQTGPDSQRSFASTPEWAKTAADWMNTATGGDEIQPGLVDVTPDTIEHLWGYVVGGTGRFFGQVWETGSSAVTGDEIEPSNVPWVRSFYGKVDEDSQRSEYYTLREEVGAAKDAVKGYNELGRPDDAAEYMDDHPAAIASIGAFDAAEKALRKVRKAKREIDGDDTLSSREKDERLKPLEETELQIMSTARSAYARARKEARK